VTRLQNRIQKYKIFFILQYLGLVSQYITSKQSVKKKQKKKMKEKS